MACWRLFSCSMLMCESSYNKPADSLYAGVFIFFLASFYSPATISLLKPQAKAHLYLIFSFPSAPNLPVVKEISVIFM